MKTLTLAKTLFWTFVSAAAVTGCSVPMNQKHSDGKPVIHQSVDKKGGDKKDGDKKTPKHATALDIQQNQKSTPAKKDAKHTQTNMYQANQPYAYECVNDNNDKAYVVAKYNPKVQTALVNITANKLGLERADVEMRQDTAASGVRFVNLKNPASTYEWHTKDTIAVLTVTVDKVDYQYNCTFEAL